MSIYQWINKEKLRYYTITIQKESDREIVLNHSWGSIKSNRGGKKNLVTQSEEEVQQCIHKMMKRRKSRGYELIMQSSL
jgi:predicted DNA-binding WGR domain protein